MQSLVNVYMHDHKTGLPKGQTGPMLCLAEDEQAHTYASIAAAAANRQTEENNKDLQDKNTDNIKDADLDVVKGGKKGNGKGKG